METAKAGKKAKGISKEKIIDSYIEHVLVEGRQPASVFLFAKSLKIREEEFYSFFNSFDALEKQLWDSWLKDTIGVIMEDNQYQSYTVREKLLALFFTWIEALKKNRSFALNQFEKVGKRELLPAFLLKTRETFEEFFSELMIEGIETGEIIDRRPVSRQYQKVFWAQFIFVTRFWINDDSQDFEKTDAFIEKSVNFSFDLAGRGVIDSFLDLSKFMVQNMRPF